MQSVTKSAMESTVESTGEEISASLDVMNMCDENSEKSEEGVESLDDTNCPGLRRKRSILRGLAEVKKRLHILRSRSLGAISPNINLVEIDNSLPKCLEKKLFHVQIEGNLDESLFPKGLGFFLMSHFVAFEEESIQEIRAMIMNIGSLEIQDGLLSFLNDYVVQSRLLKEATNQREEILASVIDWMESEGQNLKKLKSAGLDAAMGTEEKLSRVYLQTLSVMERLALLRKQLMLLDRSKKPQTPGSGSQDSSEPEFSSFEAELETEAATFQCSVRPYEDLLNLVHNVKDDSNRELMADIERKLEELGNLITDRDGNAREARATLRTKQEERERLLEQIECMKEYNDKLSAQVLELEGQETEQKKVKEDFSCQVSIENLRTVSVTKTGRKPAAPKRASDVGVRRPSRLSRPPSAQKSRGRRSTDGILDMRKRSPSTSPAPPSSRVDRKAPKAADQLVKKTSQTRDTNIRRSSQHRTKSTIVPSKPEELQAAAEKPSGSGLIQNAGTDESSAEAKKSQGRRRSSRKRMSKKDLSSKCEEGSRQTSASRDRDSSVGKSDKSDKLDKSDSKVEARLVIPHDRLEQLLQRHITNALAIAQPLLEQLMALRRNARTEIERIKNRESIMIAMEDRMTTFLQQTPVTREKLPIIEVTLDRTNIVVSNRNPTLHKCPLCVCHDTTSKSVDLVELRSPALLKKTLDTCKEYTDILANMRDSYMEVCDRVSQGQATIQTMLNQLVWGELGTSDYSNLDEDVDAEMRWTIKTAKHLPELLPDLLRHAVYVTNTVRLVVRDIVAIVRHAKIRITDVKTQAEQLCELEKVLGGARTIMDDTALQLSRLRAGAEPLNNENVLGICKCPCCKCYNSVVDDGTRITKAADRSTTNKLILVYNMALLQQALGAVLRGSDQSGEQGTVLTGVSSQVIEDVQETQCKLSEALAYMNEEDTTKRA